MSDHSKHVDELGRKVRKVEDNRLLAAGLLVGAFYGIAAGLQLAEAKTQKDARRRGELNRLAELDRMVDEIGLGTLVLAEREGLEPEQIAVLVEERRRRRMEESFRRATS